MKLITPSDRKIIPLQKLKEKLFSSTDEVNKEIIHITGLLGSIAASALLKEIRDPNKATSDHLSRVNGKYSWGITTEDEHQDGLGEIAVNDPAESLFGATTRQLQCYGRVSLGNAGGVSTIQFNGDLRRILPTENKDKGISKNNGLFHMLSTEMKNSLMLVAREDRDKLRKFDASALEDQRAEKERKEELLKMRGLKKATESYIDSIYYHEMYHSAACWKTSAAVDIELKKLKSKSRQLNALKENIRMRVIGLGLGVLQHHGRGTEKTLRQNSYQVT